jgi:Glycosyltransferase sugar-binding region containing DXD motif
MTSTPSRRGATTGFSLAMDLGESVAILIPKFTRSSLEGKARDLGRWGPAPASLSRSAFAFGLGSRFGENESAPRLFDHMILLSPSSLYSNTATCLEFLRKLPAASGDRRRDGRQRFHCYWSGRFGGKQALSIKSCLATQDCDLWLWLDHASALEAHQQNRYLKPLLPHITVRRYCPVEEAADTPLRGSPPLEERALAHRSDVFRILILFKYGGCYFDLDMLFLRNIADLAGVTAHQEHAINTRRFFLSDDKEC